MTTTFVPQVAVVDFHHARGPEIEFWIQPAGLELFNANDWSLLPFLALADGAHAVEEEFSYFTLLAKTSHPAPSSASGAEPQPEKPTLSSDQSLFGIACTRQIRSDKLKVRSPDVTRSTVQKAVVVILEQPGKLGEIRERLGAVAAAWFGQADFTNIEILQDFQESLARDAARTDSHEPYIGLSIREMVHELRHHTLVLFKALLLQKKMLFFGTRCERLCLLQFALISLIPNLLQNLQDCADPVLDSYARTVTRAVSLRTSERSSLLAYMGLPLQIFGASSFFSPYTPLQLLDLLMSTKTHSFVVGSTNNLLLSQKERYADVLVNLDEEASGAKIQILNPALRGALSLSAADRRWMDSITQTVLETWDPDNPSRPTTHAYSGSEDAIRLQFEEYLLSLCSSAAYKTYQNTQSISSVSTSALSGHSHEQYVDPMETSNDFNNEFLSSWRSTPNYALFDKLTRDASVFDIIPPKHPTAGGLNIEDVQRRLAQGVAELHLDERVRGGKQTVGRVLGESRERAAAGVARFWKEVEGFKERREASRTRGDDNANYRASTDADRRGSATVDVSQLRDDIGGIDHSNASSRLSNDHSTAASAAAATAGTTWLSTVRDRASKVQIQRPEINTTQISSAARDNAAKAGAYLSSWGSWARDRSKEWGEKRTQGVDPSRVTGGTGTKAGTEDRSDIGHVRESDF